MARQDEWLLERLVDRYPPYLALRKACGPPLVKIDTLEVGELWYYDNGHVSVMACLGDRSLLVAYDNGKPRQVVFAQFRSAHAWLRGEQVEPPAEMPLVFAAREEASGKILVRREYIKAWRGYMYATEETSGKILVRRDWPGDWYDLFLVPLPPIQREYPHRW